MTIATSALREVDGAERLQLTLAGVAELARVRRPVATVWRTRFADGPDAFPRPNGRRNGALLFDAREVGEWLDRTGHGNNPSAAADAAASAAPASLDWAVPAHAAELEALVVLSRFAGGIADMAPEALLEVAREADPADEMLLSEISQHLARNVSWSHFTDELIDAAYSPAGALKVIRSRRTTAQATDGSAGPLAADAWELVVDAAATLAHRGHLERVVIDRGIDEEAALRIAGQLGDEPAVTLSAASAARTIRRWFTAADMWLDTDTDAAPDRAMRVARVPVTPGDTVMQMLTDAESVALSLGDGDAAIVIGPARALIEALPSAARRVRDDVLRSGRLRAAVRLPPGLVTSATRDALALWVLAPPVGDVPLDARFTAVADLIDMQLTDAARHDLVTDIIAGMGSAADVRARTFRFARLARTASLLARSGSLVTARSTPKPTHASPAALAAHVDAAALAAARDLPAGIRTASEQRAAVLPAALPDLVTAGHLRLIQGTRVSGIETGVSGLIVVTADDLDRPALIGTRRVDQLTFARTHPSAQLTRPGDVIFRTGPTPTAWVDTEGSKVVAYPARVLRITAADPGGLVPEVVAADIPTQPAGPGAWKRWMLRRVAPPSIRPLRSALAELDAARTELERRIAALDQYADTLTAAVAAGAVTLTDPNDAATAAPAPQ